MLYQTCLIFFLLQNMMKNILFQQFLYVQFESDVLQSIFFCEKYQKKLLIMMTEFLFLDKLSL